MLNIIQAAGWPIWPLIACSVLGLALISVATPWLKNYLKAEARLQERTDEFVAMPAPISVEAHIRRKLAAPDTGAGVFGALNYIENGVSVAKKRGTDVFTDPDWAQVR